MQTGPDDIEVVNSLDEVDRHAPPPLLVLRPLQEFLDQRGIGTGPIEWERIGDGQSNVTFLLQREDLRVVLRRGPRPPLPRSTHDMVREARIQLLVAEAGIPVPNIIATCEDNSVLGVPFYLMSYLDGIVITDTVPPSLESAAERRATSAAAVDTLVHLHAIDVTTGPLSTLGRPEGYLARQVDRFRNLWDPTFRDFPELHEIADWLAATVPVSQRASVVHGDYRLGNLMYDRAGPARVTAILDWEMASLGDPLADLGYLTATYAQERSFRTPLELTPVTSEPGYLTRDELVARYQQALPLDVAELPWYQTLAMWKAAIFCEAIYRRWVNGERPDDTSFGPSLELGIPRLLAEAGRFMGQLS